MTSVLHGPIAPAVVLERRSPRIRYGSAQRPDLPQSVLIDELGVGEGAAALRRRLGVTSWVVLEEMTQRCTGDDDDLVAVVPIRAGIPG